MATLQNLTTKVCFPEIPLKKAELNSIIGCVIFMRENCYEMAVQGELIGRYPHR